MKRLIKVLVGLVVILMIALIAVFLWINQLAKAGIEQGATYALGVDTTLDAAKIGVFSGEFGLDDLRVANPANFSADSFLELGRGEVAVSLGSLMGDEAELGYLELSDIVVSLENDGDKGNYDVILENLASHSPPSPEGEDPEPTPPQPEDQEGGKTFVIRRVVISNVTVNGRFKLVGDKPTDITFNIPEIRLNDIGSQTEGGVLLSELAGTLLTAVLEAAVRQGGDILPDVILGSLDAGLEEIGKLGEQVTVEAEKAVQEVTEQAQKIGQDLGQEIDKVGQAVEDTGKQIEKGLGELFEGLAPKDSKDDK